MKVYLPGAVSNDHDYKEKFAGNQEKLEAAGYEIINPVNLPGVNDGGWIDAMLVCLAALKEADALAVIPDGIDSVGRFIEQEAAYKTGKQIYFIEDLLREER